SSASKTLPVPVDPGRSPSPTSRFPPRAEEPSTLSRVPPFRPLGKRTANGRARGRRCETWSTGAGVRVVARAAALDPPIASFPACGMLGIGASDLHALAAPALAPPGPPFQLGRRRRDRILRDRRRRYAPLR